MQKYEKGTYLIIEIPKNELGERLSELGLIQGREIRVERAMPYGGPVIISALNCEYAIRRKDFVEIKVVKR